MNKEEKYLMAISEFENAYIEQTKGSKSHEILRNDIDDYIASLQYVNKSLKSQLDFVAYQNRCIDKLEKKINNTVYFLETISSDYDTLYSQDIDLVVDRLMKLLKGDI